MEDVDKVLKFDVVVGEGLVECQGIKLMIKMKKKVDELQILRFVNLGFLKIKFLVKEKKDIVFEKLLVFKIKIFVFLEVGMFSIVNKQEISFLVLIRFENVFDFIVDGVYV